MLNILIGILVFSLFAGLIIFDAKKSKKNRNNNNNNKEEEEK